MKRGRYDGEYEGVKRRSQMRGATAQEFPDNERRSGSEERVTAMHEEYKRAAAEADAAERKRLDEVMARVAGRRAQFNKEVLRREWLDAGVEPPWVDAEGYPRMSLGLARAIGWRVEYNEAGNAMLIPPHWHPESNT